MAKDNQILENVATDKGESSGERSRGEQRRHHRLSVNLNVQVSWIDAFGFENAAAAVVKNISAGGFGIELRHSRPLGSRLTVKSETNSMACAVRHLQPKAGMFFLGLEVLPSIDEATASQSLKSLGSALSSVPLDD